MSIKENMKVDHGQAMSPMDVFLQMLSDLSEREDEMDQLKLRVQNAVEDESWGMFSRLSEKDDASADLLSVYKKRIAEVLHHGMRETKLSVEPQHIANAESEFAQILSQKVQAEEELKQSLKSELSSIRKRKNWLMKQKDDLDEAILHRPSRGDMAMAKNQSDVQKVQERVRVTYVKLVRNMRTVMNELFADSPMALVLDRVWKAHDTSEPYVEEEPGWEADVQYLLFLGMIMRHPNDPLRIRLVDFD